MQTTPRNIANLRKIETATEWLDTKFKIPGTSISFGLDPIIGLVPVAGDFIGLVTSLGLFFTMLRYGVSGKVKVLMILNIILDTLIGSIPILGSIFDFYFKANQRNLRLMQRHYQEGKYQGSGIGIIALIFLIILFLLVCALYLIYKLFAWLF